MSYKIAVATSDGKTVDTHFGHADSFVIYEVQDSDGSYEEIEERSAHPACNAEQHCGQTAAHDSMDVAAQNLADVDYVLVSRIGPHAIQALARHQVSAFDIVLPIDEAVAKIHAYRQKIKK